MLRGYNKRILDRLFNSIQANESVSRRYLARAVRSTADIQTGRRNAAANASADEDFQQLSSNTRTAVVVGEAASAGSDYLGISEVDSEFVHGEYGYEEGAKVQSQALQQKYEPLLESSKKKAKDPSGSGKLKQTWFGQVRLDSLNVPRYHGQYERRVEGGTPLNENKLASVMQHMKKYEVKIKDDNKNDTGFERKKKQQESSQLPDDIIEVVESKTTPKSITNAKIGFLYSRDFSDELSASRRRWRANFNESTEEKKDWITYEKAKREKEPVKGAPKLEDDLSDPAIWSEKMAQVPLEEEDTTSKTGANHNQDFPLEESMNAADYLKKIYSGKVAAHFQAEVDNMQKLIKKKEVLDSKGFRILSHQVPDFSSMTNAEILDMLAKQVIFNDADVVALNKPYGMSVHGGGNTGSSSSSKFSSTTLHLNYFLPELATRLGVEKLYTVHRLDRDTTGILLLAKTQEKAHQLSRLFAEQRIDKRYLAITKNTPDIREGIIDIPIELGHAKVGNNSNIKRERMVLCPEPVEDIRAQRRSGAFHSRTARKAVTHYRVVDEAGNAALLEIHPQTGIRHQIRVHLGFGLRCPVLGDHKYSSLEGGMAPQKLPADILSRLRVRQQKARTVPMHLHAYLAVLPGCGHHGTNITLRAPLPYHFTKNMASLRLRMK